MKFSELQFDQAGCCDTHTWAVARHANGVRTEVYTVDGGYKVATFSGAVLLIAVGAVLTEAEVDVRLAADALLAAQ